MRDGKIAFSHRSAFDLSKLILVEVSIARRRRAALGETSEALGAYLSSAQEVEPFNHLDLRNFVIAVDINPAQTILYSGLEKGETKLRFK
jgi:hypothetical protein